MRRTGVMRYFFLYQGSVEIVGAERKRYLRKVNTEIYEKSFYMFKII